MGMVILQSPDELRTILESFIKILFMFASGEPFAKVYVYNSMFPNNFGVDFWQYPKSLHSHVAVHL